MRLRCEMEDCVDLVLAEDVFHACRRRYIALRESEVWLIVKDPRVIKSCAIVKFVK